jgi:hypothetical protein
MPIFVDTIYYFAEDVDEKNTAKKKKKNRFPQIASVGGRDPSSKTLKP